MQTQAYYPAAIVAPIPPCFLVDPLCHTRADPLPDVPIMPSTRLQLELLVQEPVLDLRAVAEVILADVGATLQILRLVGEEYAAEEDRPTRMEDCIASLNTETWFEAVCASTLIQNSAVLAVWQHARQIGQYLERAAGCEEGPCPWEAQLVGLLHEVGRLPELLGWQSPATDSSGAADSSDLSVVADSAVASASANAADAGVGALLAEHWHLPVCVLAAAREQERPESSSVWTSLLKAAHQWVVEQDSPFGALAEASLA